MKRSLAYFFSVSAIVISIINISLNTYGCSTEAPGSVKEALAERMLDFGCYEAQPCYAVVNKTSNGGAVLEVYQCAGSPRLMPLGAIQPETIWSESRPNQGGVASYVLYNDGSGELSGFTSGSMPPTRLADPEMVAMVKAMGQCGHVPPSLLPQAIDWELLYGQDWPSRYEVDCNPSTCKTWVAGGELLFSSD
ncbi:MAG: hypothetical protein ABH826_02195 [Patescibacteria group bacterium]